MTGFQTIIVSDVRCHSGVPNCDGAHAALLAMLNALAVQYLGPATTLSNSQKGNVGEFITYHIARSAYPLPDHVRFSNNALNPFSRISGAGLDLVYVYFDSVSPANDLLYIQEVKTTGATNLDYFDALTADYRKRSVCERFQSTTAQPRPIGSKRINGLEQLSQLESH